MFHLWKRSRFSFKMFTGFGLVALIYLGSSLYIFKQVTYLQKVINQSVQVDVPKALAGKEIQYELVKGHLELEEMMDGDASISVEMIRKPWEIALSYANAMLVGGTVVEQTFVAVTDPQEKDLLRSFVKNLNHMLSIANIRIKKVDQHVEAGAGSALDQAFDAAFIATMEPMKELEALFTHKSALSTHEADQVSRDVQNHLMMVMVLVLLSCITIPLIFSHYIVVRPLSFLQKSCTQLSNSASTMSCHAREQEAAAIEQETTTQQIAASTREISATSQELVRSMQEVAQVVDSTSKLAKGGRGNLSRMEKTIGQMMNASKNIGAKLSLLNEKASNITTVVTTINKVADQTNLLSVNAAIEADKAGEYGIGFGTVASEIRRLSDQTAIATSDIEEMVKEMQAAVSAGVMGMESFSNEIQNGVEDVQKVGQQLAQIIERVQTLGPHFEVVHQGMNVQADGAEQISESISQLSEAMRMTSKTTNDSYKIIEDLNDESKRMREAVARFNLGPNENEG